VHRSNAITGIDPVELRRATYDLDDVLSQLRSTLQGTYVLSYNLGFDVGKLREATQRKQLPEIVIVGEDLMAQAMRYFNQSSYPKLEILCQSIGQSLPPQPTQNAIDRAKGQISLLTAIADVVPIQIGCTNFSGNHG
jgi:DNA polymerase III epsilon subunit-like protein